jgi:ubiquinone biosynthesis protein
VIGLTYRLLDASALLGMIFLDYLVQWGLAALLCEWEREDGREVRRLPAWLERRRERIDARNARRLYRGMVRLRGVFIKLGQVLSIMGGFLPRVYQKELERLQDRVPPRSFDEIARAFEQSLGTPISRAFDEVEREPLAAASLGQVHVAYRIGEDGARQKLAVKVLYPGIREVIAVDMKVLAVAVRIYSLFVPVQGITRVHSALVDLLARETDYRHEAKSMVRMAENFRGQRDVLFPQPVSELVSGDVLTMTFMDGIRIGSPDSMRAAGIDPGALATRLVEILYEQIFVHRFFHADPHPGNFLVRAGKSPSRPSIVILDFGAVSDVRDDLVEGMLDVIGGVLEHDQEKLVAGFYRMGFASAEGNRELLERTIEAYFKKLLRLEQRTAGALMRADPRELEKLADPGVAQGELRELMKSVEYPEGWFYVERSAVLAFWLVGQLDPELDAMQVGYPYIMSLLAERRLRAEESLQRG